MDWLAAIKQRLMPVGIPLAWLQLAGEKARLVAAVAGIAFASMMMVMQLGFHDALFDSACRLHYNLHGELVMISSQYESTVFTKNFTRRRLYQVLGHEAVESVAPIYLGTANWRNPDTMRDRSIFVIGFNPETETLILPGLRTNISLTKLPDVVLFDSGSRREFGPIEENVLQSKTVVTEMSGRKVSILGLFEMGTSFAADGNAITSDLNFLRIFKGRSPGVIDIGLIKLKAGADVEKTRAAITASIPPDVQVLTRDSFVRLEKDFWGNRTPIGFVIFAGLAVGFVVGCVIVYQILYTDVVDHMKEYATLKAMGYTDRFLFSVVLQEAALLSVFGFIPGCIVAAGILYLTRVVTLLPAYTTPGRALLVFTLTFLMCTVSGALAMRKLKQADPAEIF
jgi:putative ABC transport system permease protein